MNWYKVDSKSSWLCVHPTPPFQSSSRIWLSGVFPTSSSSLSSPHLYRYTPSPPSTPQVAKEMAHGLVSMLVLCVQDIIISARRGEDGEKWDENGLRWEEVVYFLISLLWSDLHFYITHRILHVIPWLYKNVHKVFSLLNFTLRSCNLHFSMLHHFSFFRFIMSLPTHRLGQGTPSTL